MQQIYKTLPISYDFNKVALQLFWTTLRHGRSSVNLQHSFRRPFYKNTRGGLLLKPNNFFFESEECLGLHLKIKSFATIEVVAKTSKDKELCNYRSSRPEVFFKKDILRNFTTFTGKHLSLRPATLLKKTLWQRCIPVNFVKLLRTPFLHRTPLVVASATVVNG